MNADYGIQKIFVASEYYCMKAFLKALAGVLIPGPSELDILVWDDWGLKQADIYTILPNQQRNGLFWGCLGGHGERWLNAMAVPRQCTCPWLCGLVLPLWSCCCPRRPTGDNRQPACHLDGPWDQLFRKGPTESQKDCSNSYPWTLLIMDPLTKGQIAKKKKHLWIPQHPRSGWAIFP